MNRQKENVKHPIGSDRLFSISKIIDNVLETAQDPVASEEPLEIRVQWHKDGSIITNNITVTMRTPGNDFELAIGFLFSEGIIQSALNIVDVHFSDEKTDEQPYNIVTVVLDKGVELDPEKYTRNVYMNSSCGVCGRTSLQMVRNASPKRPIGEFSIVSKELQRMQRVLRNEQELFSRTGGVHASGIFTIEGKLLQLHEDVGRHNALDKVIGSSLLKQKLPLSNTILLVSGRASFELVQKAILAGIPFLASVGAPSTLAVEMAQDFGITLVGFLNEKRFNVYTGEERIG